MQDFYGEKGDRASGRETVVILYPKLSRALTPFLMTSWALVLPRIWDTAMPVSLSFGLFGIYIAARILAFRDQISDEMSYFLYNVSRAHLFVYKY